MSNTQFLYSGAARIGFKVNFITIESIESESIVRFPEFSLAFSSFCASFESFETCALIKVEIRLISLSLKETYKT